MKTAAPSMQGPGMIEPIFPRSTESPLLSGRRYFNLPNLMSAVRLPLAIAFGMSLDRPVVALSILVLAALSDMLDGMIARWTHQSSKVGAIVDPIFDKLFVLIAIISLVVGGLVSPLDLSLILTRDLAMIPMVLALPFASARTRSMLTMRSNVFGKITTVAQFCALIASLLMPAYVHELSLLSALLGVACIGSYFLRGYREHQRILGLSPRNPAENA